MDIEKLIEQLKNLEACAYGYHINGEVLGMDCSDFEQVMVDAADSLSTLHAENERLKNKLSELAHLPFDEPGIGERTRLMAENAELRAELEQAKRERRIIPKGYALVKLKLLEELDNFRELGPIDRLRELAQADREKRIIVIPKDNNELLEKLKDLFFSDWATLRREQDG